MKPEIDLSSRIDIKPIEEKANDFWRTCMEMREINCLYVIRLANGENYSVEFDEKSLSEFCPKQTISEIISSSEESLVRNYELAKKAVETGIHPFWKRSIKELHPITQIWTGKYIAVDYDMSNSDIESWKRYMERAERRLGKLTFVKIVL